MLQSNRIKHIPIKSDMFRCKTHWEQGLLPETIMLEFNFRIKANHDKLKDEFKNIGEIREYVTEHLSISKVSDISSGINLGDFNFDFAVYNYDRDVESITKLFYNKHVDNMTFGFYVVLVHKDATLLCNADSVKKNSKKFATAFGNKYFKNKKVLKYFSISK